MKKQSHIDNALKNILRSHTVVTSLHGLPLEPTIQLAWPDLSNFDRSAGGDWGTCYRIHTGCNAQISFSYAHLSDKVIQHIVQPSHLLLQAPILFSERQKISWYIDFTDTKSSLTIRCFFDTHGELHTTKIEKSCANFHIEEDRNRFFTEEPYKQQTQAMNRGFQ